MNRKKIRFRTGNLHRDQSGAALMVAIVIIFVLVALSASILMVAYALHGTTLKQTRSIECHELAINVSELIKNQVYAESMSFEIESAGDFKQKMKDGWVKENYPLWYYLRTQILQGDNVWRYYDETGEDYAHSSQAAFRQLQLDFGGPSYSDEFYGYEISTTMYWISTKKEAAGDLGRPEQKFRAATPMLVVIVECRQGDIKSVVTSKYDLSVGNFDRGIEQPDEGEDYTVVVDENKLIYWNENWKFTLRSMK